MNDFSKVKLLGRTYEADGILWLAHSASGIEFSFTGKTLSIVIAGDDATKKKAKEPARLAIYVDGERKFDKMVRTENSTIRVIRTLKSMKHEIRILKLTEAPMSIFGIRNIISDGEGTIEPLPEKERKIEFIGDSITCGYGVDDENPEHHYKTSTEDATKAFAYKTAVLLNADYSLVSYSGHGIISGYVEGDVPKLQELVPPYYGSVAYSRGLINGKQLWHTEWDFTKFVPDTIVINLGTNDDSYCRDYEERQKHFARSYAAFLKEVHARNPEARLCLILGVMGARLFPFVKEAMEIFQKETGYDNISAHKIEPIELYEGYVADYHPTVKTHDRVANTLAKILEK